MATRNSQRRGTVKRVGGDHIRVESSVGVLELIADRKRPGGLLLLIDGLTHGYVDLNDPSHLEIDYVARIAAALEVLVPRNAAASVLHLGGGAFSLPRFLASTRPTLHQTVVEKSGAVIKLAERHLRLRRSERLEVIQADATREIERFADGTFDLVLGDAFIGTETPASMSTTAYAEHVRRVLRPTGSYVLNVVDQPPWPVVADQATILQQVFTDVLAFGGREVVRGQHAGNMLFVASAAPLPRDAIARCVAGGAHPAELVPGIGRAAG